MERLLLTQDGSHTLFNASLNQYYHSLRGAVQESLLISIELGLAYASKARTEIKVLEMGFGTGLNALLSWQYASANGLIVHYTSIDKYPITVEEAALLNYGTLLSSEGLLHLHQAAWQQDCELDKCFVLRKQQVDLLNYEPDQQQYHVVYFDAFAPNAQPELWTVAVFEKLASALSVGGVLTTYSSKGIVRRNLEAAGFCVERHRGSGNKKHVVRAIKK